MASHHHHYYCQNPPHTTITASSSCSGCCNHPPPPPPSQGAVDPLLQDLSFLLRQQLQREHNNISNTCPCLNKPHHTHKSHYHRPLLHPNTQHFRWDPQQLRQESHLVISSLLQRINNLESELHHLSSSPIEANRYNSLREAAARVIQKHFRAFLVCRSRTLRQLKELAFAKTSLISLKSTVSNKTHFNSEVISRTAMDLLLRVDSIEGGDPMIRDGKRSVTRDIVRFLDFVDGFTLRRNGLGSARNVDKCGALGVRYGKGKLGGNRKEKMEELRGRVEKFRGFARVCGDDENDVEVEGFQQVFDHGVDDGMSGASRTRKAVWVKGIGVQPRVKKSVSFAGNGNVYRVIDDECEPVLHKNVSYVDESDLSDYHGHVVKNQFDIVEESRGISIGKKDGDEAQSENEGSSQCSDGESSSKRGARGSSSNGTNNYFQDQDGNLALSSPLPVKMEQRADLKKRQGVKIIG